MRMMMMRRRRRKRRRGVRRRRRRRRRRRKVYSKPTQWRRRRSVRGGCEVWEDDVDRKQVALRGLQEMVEVMVVVEWGESKREGGTGEERERGWERECASEWARETGLERERERVRESEREQVRERGGREGKRGREGEREATTHVCFFVLCKRHGFNRAPGAHRGDSLCIPLALTLTRDFIVL